MDQVQYNDQCHIFVHAILILVGRASTSVPATGPGWYTSDTATAYNIQYSPALRTQSHPHFLAARSLLGRTLYHRQ